MLFRSDPETGEVLDKTAEKFAAIGVSMDQLQGKKPEEQFRAIAKAIGAIQDPTQRAAAAVSIFGKSGTELLPLFAEDIDALMAKAKELGVAGLVVGGIHDKDLRALLGYDLGVAITGTEQVGFTLILTEGFGTIPMAAKTFKLLSAHEGQKASISGATQIRAGVIRPEIIIPQAAAAAAEAVHAQREGIRIGDPVRIIRDPLFGKIGEVSALPSDLTKIPTESEVRVLEVTFADGARTVIPRTNIEVIEGA